MCGRDSTAPTRYEVIFDGDDSDAAEDDLVSSEACPRCGYRRLAVLSWDGIVTDPEQVREDRARLRELEERRDRYLAEHPDLTEGTEQVPDYPPSEDGWGGGSSL